CGRGVFHFTFCVADHSSGAVSPAGATPSRVGPRYIGQSAACSGDAERQTESSEPANKLRSKRRGIVCSSNCAIEMIQKELPPARKNVADITLSGRETNADSESRTAWAELESFAGGRPRMPGRPL